MLKFAKYLAVAVVSVLLAAGGYGWWAWRQIDAIPRFEAPAPAVSPASPSLPPAAQDAVAYLVFSVGSKGLDADAAERTGIGRGRAAMADGLTDSLMLVLMNPLGRSVAVISIPRDTLVPSSGRRINEAYNRGGIDQLVAEVEELTGVRADHQVSVNFAAFADLTVAVGGVDLLIQDRVIDKQAKLAIEVPGCVHLEGADALAFARSRHWLVVNEDGSARADASSSDWGRIERQQAIVRALAAKLVNPSLALRIPELLGIAQQNLVLDAGLGTSDLLALARAYAPGVAHLPAITYPGRGATVNGASVIIPDTESGLAAVRRIAEQIGYLAQVGVPGPDTATAASSVQTSSPAPDAVPSTPAPKASLPASAPTATAPASPSASAKPSGLPDRTSGLGGTRYPTCSPGHSPRR
jgi:LCP family protein required for cell wall assembly